MSSRRGGRGWEGGYDVTGLRVVECAVAGRDRPQRSLCAVLVDICGALSNFVKLASNACAVVVSKILQVCEKSGGQ